MLQNAVELRNAFEPWMILKLRLIRRRSDMARIRHLAYAATAAACCFGAAVTPATAIDAALAKQCNAMLAKAFPPAVPGNPAAGSKNGDATQQRAYFKKCIDNNGKVDDAPAADKK
jgi:hypothetical protein